MKTLRELAAEAIKYSVIIGVFLLLQAFDSPASDLQAVSTSGSIATYAAPSEPDVQGHLVEQLLTAGLASVLSVIFLDVILGRPVLLASWSVNYRPAPSGRPELSVGVMSGHPPISLAYVLEGSGLLYTWARYLADKGKLTCELTITPSAVVAGSLQAGRSHHEFVLQGNVLQTKLLDGFQPEGTVECLFTLIPFEESPMPRKIGCTMRLVGETKGATRLLNLLVKCEPTIEGFSLKGNI